jgi:hypothetical protein
LDQWVLIVYDLLDFLLLRLKDIVGLGSRAAANSLSFYFRCVEFIVHLDPLHLLVPGSIAYGEYDLVDGFLECCVEPFLRVVLGVRTELDDKQGLHAVKLLL